MIRIELLANGFYRAYHYPTGFAALFTASGELRNGTEVEGMRAAVLAKTTTHREDSPDAMLSLRGV